MESWVKCLGSVNLPDSCLPDLLSSASKPNADDVGQRTCTVWRSRKCVVWPDWENNCTVLGESDATLRDAEYGCDWRGASKSDHLVYLSGKRRLFRDERIIFFYVRSLWNLRS